MIEISNTQLDGILNAAGATARVIARVIDSLAEEGVTATIEWDNADQSYAAIIDGETVWNGDINPETDADAVAGAILIAIEHDSDE